MRFDEPPVPRRSYPVPISDHLIALIPGFIMGLIVGILLGVAYERSQVQVRPQSYVPVPEVSLAPDSSSA